MAQAPLSPRESRTAALSVSSTPLNLSPLTQHSSSSLLNASNHMSMNTIQEVDTVSTKEGWLHKEGGNFKTWRRRYFKLKNGAVSYYDSDKKEEKPKGTIPLEGCAIQDADQKMNKKFMIEIYHANRRVYYLQCENESDKESWMEALKQHVDLHAAQILAFKSKERSYRQQIDNLKNQVELLRITAEDRRVRAEKCELHLGDLELTIKNKDALVQTLQEENRSLLARIHSMETVTPLPANVPSSADLEQKVSHMQEQITKLQNELVKEKQNKRLYKESAKLLKAQLETKSQELSIAQATAATANAHISSSSLSLSSSFSSSINDSSNIILSSAMPISTSLSTDSIPSHRRALSSKTTEDVPIRKIGPRPPPGAPPPTFNNFQT